MANGHVGVIVINANLHRGKLTDHEKTIFFKTIICLIKKFYFILFQYLMKTL